MQKAIILFLGIAVVIAVYTLPTLFCEIILQGVKFLK